MDHLQAYQCQIRKILHATYAINIISLDNILMQISNIMFVEKKNIFTITILEKFSLIDNKARVLRHPA